MVDLTGEQAQLLEHLNSQRFVSVLGCAGSGKTTLAAAFAAQLSQAGSHVLMLCRNPYLAEDLTQRLAGSGVEVYAFPAFVRSLLLSDHSPDVFVPRSPSGWQAPWTQFDAPTQSDLRRALDILQRTDQLYEAVIVDEGQDFETVWLEVAESVLEGQPGRAFRDLLSMTTPGWHHSVHSVSMLMCRRRLSCRAACAVEGRLTACCAVCIRVVRSLTNRQRRGARSGSGYTPMNPGCSTACARRCWLPKRATLCWMVWLC